MTNEAYHNSDGISSSDFRLLEESPMHLDNKALFKLSGKQFTLGSLVHAMVLEPEIIEEEFVREDFDGCDLNKNTKAYKAAKADWLKTTGGKVIVSNDDWIQAMKMTENVLAIAGNLLQNGVAEESLFIEDTEFGIIRKCRPDYYREDLGIVIDLKTTKDSSDRSFANSIVNFNYHRQASFYISTLQMANKKVDRFVFIMVDTQKPYMVRIRELGKASIQVGEEDYRKHLETYREYKENDVGIDIKTVNVPEWVIEA